MVTLPKKVNLKRVRTFLNEKRRKSTIFFQVYYDDKPQFHLLYTANENMAHNIIRDLKKKLNLTNREMHQKLSEGHLHIIVEFNEHIAFSVLPSSPKYSYSQWMFLT